MSKLVPIRIVFVTLAVIGVYLILRQMEIDACLDGGGSYNTVFKKCETAGNASYVPVLQRDHWYVPVIFSSAKRRHVIAPGVSPGVGNPSKIGALKGRHKFELNQHLSPANAGLKFEGT